MKSKTAAFLVTGSEILDGRVVDTNSAYLASELLELGIRVSEIVKIGDEKGAIAARLKVLIEQYDLVMVSGGLGPTTDDLTRDGVAEALGLKLTLDEIELKRLEDYFAARGRKFFDQARQQAYFPGGSILLANYAGSAAGFCVPVGPRLVAVTPGPPVELRSVWERSLRPLLMQKFGVNPLPTVFFRLFGIPESYVGQAVIDAGIGGDVEVSYRAVSPEVHLMFKGELPAIKKAESDFLPRIDQNCIVNRDKNISAVDEVCKLLQGAGRTLRISEYFPCGLAFNFTSSKNCADHFAGAEISSLSGAKLGVDAAEYHARELRVGEPNTIGLVVSETAKESAKEGRFIVSVALDESTVKTKSYYIAGDLPRVRRYAVGAAIDLVRRALLGVSLLDSI